MFKNPVYVFNMKQKKACIAASLSLSVPYAFVKLLGDIDWLNFVNILTTRVAHAEDCFPIVFQMVHIRSTATRVVCFASIEDVAVAQYTILAILDFPFSFHFFLLSMIFVSI